jgi:hypothetical protein
MKIFYNGRRINGRFDTFKAAARRFIRKSLIASVVVSAGALLFLFGQLYASNTVSVAFASTTAVGIGSYSSKNSGL